MRRVRPRSPPVSPPQCRLQIVDASGQERFRVVVGSCIRRADGIVIVYDITSRASFEHVRSWVSDIERLSASSCVCGPLPTLAHDRGTVTRTLEEGSSRISACDGGV